MLTKQQVDGTIQIAIHYALRMYKPELGLFGGFPSLPFRVFIHEIGSWLKTGTTCCMCQKVAKDTYYYYFNCPSKHETRQTYGDVVLKVHYMPVGQKMKCKVILKNHKREYHSDVYLGQYSLWNYAGGIEQRHVGKAKTLRFEALPSNVYSIRNNCLAWKVLKPFYPKLSKKVKHIVEKLGFKKDLYDPLFGLTYNTPYDAELYKDCNPIIFRQLPNGSSYHPYKSSVFLVNPYIWAHLITKFDPLCWSLEVINDFFKDHRVKDWHKQKLDKCNFDGYGLRGGLMALASEYSTTRLAVYMAANVTIGEMDIADRCAEILLQLQWRGSGYVWAKRKLYIKRSDHYGGFYRAYKPLGESYVCSILTRDEIFRVIQHLPESIQKLFPIPEVPTSDILTDIERTMVAIASLIVYRSKKWGEMRSL